MVYDFNTGLPIRAYVSEGTQQLIVNLGVGQPGRYNLALYNLLGQQVHSEAFTKPTSVLTQRVNVSALPAGVYVVRIEATGTDYRQKVVKR